MDHLVYFEFQAIHQKLDQLIAAQAILTNLENLTVSKIDDLEAEVTKVNTVADSAVVLINGIAQQLRDMQSADPRVQAVIDSLDSKSSALAAAVAANTPAEQPPAGPAGPAEPPA